MIALRAAAAALLTAATGAALMAWSGSATAPPQVHDTGTVPSFTPVLAAPAASAAGAHPASIAVPPGPPIRLAVARLAVRARVVPVALTHGSLAVPDDPRRVGWWQASAAAGATTGTVVLDGHVDSARDGLGALFHLTRLRPGDHLVVSTRSGADFDYRVVARRVVHKSDGLPAALFDPTAPGVLAVVTCGGPFANGSYRDNVVVLARLVTTQPPPSHRQRS